MAYNGGSLRIPINLGFLYYTQPTVFPEKILYTCFQRFKIFLKFPYNSSLETYHPYNFSLKIYHFQKYSFETCHLQKSFSHRSQSTATLSVTRETKGETRRHLPFLTESVSFASPSLKMSLRFIFFFERNNKFIW